MPAWVRDVQINRQLDSIIQLRGKLRNLLDNDDLETNKIDLYTETSLRKNSLEEHNKKNLKMWFSPRSKRMRCIMEKAGKAKPIEPKLENVQPLSAYDFVSSSPNCKSLKKKHDQKSKKNKKKRLKGINREWGFDNKVDESSDHSKEEMCGKSVSFGSSVVVLENKQNNGLLEDNGLNKNQRKLDELKKDQMDTRRKLTIYTESEQSICFGNLPKGKKQTPAKRNVSLVTTKLKRSKTKSSIDANETVSESDLETVSSTHFESVLTPHKNTKFVNNQDSGTEGIKTVLPITEICSTPSAHSRNKFNAKANKKTSALQTSPNNLANMKRNYKGETMLHVASIKGDIEGVKHLLNEGANPNVKDNAGWTPLHEACNLGHTKVVEYLLNHHALVNTTGYQNDTPLHDAVKNGHKAIVQLLLTHGASQNAVNIFGLRPVDYAETEEMKSVLLKTQATKEPILVHPFPPSLCQRKEETIVLMASGLSTLQRADLKKLSKILNAHLYFEYSSAVTHIIVHDEPVLRTMKCMLGTLAGCWILRFAWVKNCLESCRQEPEEPQEVHGGSKRARLNKVQLLPRLLDGCHFYFLGCFKEHCKEDLMELVKAAGGQILIRQPKPDSDVTQMINTVAYHAEPNSDQRFCTQYIVYDKTSKYIPERVRQGKVWFAPSSWLIECIASFHLIPVPHIYSDENK
ncbi:hypothetical protein GDO86_019088 [Hymenochirus boettgeri]|nr:hypothetical protein GDO86_019088 [Hymenochirus boettgeri]KAG8431307.1 hypothetical protein GDO86_019088 [Hymenochirus boettgeri]